jgi:flagellar M-ring protein FliF
MKQVGSIISSYRAMDGRARIGVGVGAGIILLGTLAALWWTLSPSERLLFGNLPETDAAEIASALDEWKVPHRFSDDGTGILVDESQMHAVRMRLVSAGIPTGGHVGYELFDDNEFGVTEFAQRINYQRALQGELERTIGALPGVQDVRVHLSIRRAGLFLADDVQSKASVAITLLPGSQLERRQVNGIRNLVASAVEGLNPESVVVVGPSGLQLSPGTGADAMLATGDQSDSARELATALESKLEQMLAEALPGQRASVSVNVRMNFDRVHRTSERLLAQPGSNQGVVVKRSSNGAQPPEAGAAAASLNEQVEYAHGKEREEVTRAAGTVERISVAVMLPSSLPVAEQDHLRRLISAAAGIDPARGDTLEIAAAPAVSQPSTQTRIEGEGQRRIVAGTAAPATGLPLWNGRNFGLALAAWLLGIVMGGWVVTRRQRNPRLLSAAESEAAVRKVRVWLADGAA